MMAPYAWALVAVSMVHYCNSGPIMVGIARAWPLSLFMAPQWVKEDPDEPERCDVWSVIVKNHEDVIEHFDSRDACVLYKEFDSLTRGYVECKPVEPPT